MDDDGGRTSSSSTTAVFRSSLILPVPLKNNTQFDYHRHISTPGCPHDQTIARPMWYPSSPSWHPYIHPSTLPAPTSTSLLQQQQPHLNHHRHRHQQQHTPYYVNQTDDSSIQSHSTTSSSPSETSMHHYQGSYEMRNTDYDLFHREEIVPSQTRNVHCNPIIAAPKRLSITTTTTIASSTASSTTNSSSSTTWDWLIYSPNFDSHLYRPASSSIFIQSSMKYPDDEDELDILASLPSWLLALLSHSNQTMADENEMDQEILSLQQQQQQQQNRYERDEPCLTMHHVSSHRPLSSDPLHSQQTSKEQHRSSTPDTDDGYQSASDASRSDYSQQSSSTNSQVSTRISYAAAVKPMPLHSSYFQSNRKSVAPSPLITTNDSNANLSNQKLKFIAPRFERMHHAKQYSSSTISSTATTTTTTKSRSNPHGQRHPISHSTRRR